MGHGNQVCPRSLSRSLNRHITRGPNCGGKKTGAPVEPGHALKKDGPQHAKGAGRKAREQHPAHELSQGSDHDRGEIEAERRSNRDLAGGEPPVGQATHPVQKRECRDRSEATQEPRQRSANPMTGGSATDRRERRAERANPRAGA